MFGRRPDGIRIKDIDPVMRITPYVMPMRCDAQVMMKHRADMEIFTDYIKRKRAENKHTVSHMEIFIAAFVRAVSRNPEVNRFIMNKQIFARNNCSVAFTILKHPHDSNSDEAVVKIKFDLTDTIFDVADRIDAAIDDARSEEADRYSDKLLNVLFGIPGLPTLATGVIGFLDRYGLAPKAMIDNLPFYASTYITNTASIGLHDVNHHIYNWGDVSGFLSLGLTEKVAVVEDGKTRMKPFLPIGITVDERVCSGAHYARFYSDFKHYLEHPEQLEEPPEGVRFDKECEYHEPKVKKEQA